MSGRRPFSDLSRGIDSDPLRRVRVDEIKRAMVDVMGLAALREEREVTQQRLASAMRVSQANVSRIEHQHDVYLSTLMTYVEALGGELQLRAVFDDAVIELMSSEAQPEDRVSSRATLGSDARPTGEREGEEGGASRLRARRRVRLVA